MKYLPHPRVRACGLAAAMAISLCGCQKTPLDPVTSRLRDLLRDGTIVRMKVVHVPYATSSFAAIQPYQMHEDGLDISRDTVPGPFETLQAALEKATAIPLHRPPNFIHGTSTVTVDGQVCYPVDVRWSCILYDKDNKEVGSIFLGRRLWWGQGKVGIMGDKLFVLNRSLISWFEDNFFKLFGERVTLPPTPSPTPRI